MITPIDTALADGLASGLKAIGRPQQWLADEMTSRGHKWHQATVYKVLRKQRKVTIGEAVDAVAIIRAELERIVVQP